MTCIFLQWRLTSCLYTPKLDSAFIFSRLGLIKLHQVISFLPLPTTFFNIDVAVVRHPEIVLARVSAAERVCDGHHGQLGHGQLGHGVEW
jgi:hypothetical protein